MRPWSHTAESRINVVYGCTRVADVFPLAADEQEVIECVATALRTPDAPRIDVYI